MSKHQIDSCKISVKVIVHAKKSEVISDDVDLLGMRILKVKINQPPEDGKANQALIELLATYFKVKKSAIKIIAGAKSTHKIILVGNNLLS